MTSNILIIVSLLIILLKAVDAQGSCCYSISSELNQPPDLHLLNLTASHVSSKKNNNLYRAQIGLPPKYLVQGNPSSPLSYVFCMKTVKAGTLDPVYECESRDKEIFFVQILVRFPQESNNDTTKVQLPDVNVTIFGDKCEQRAVCQDLASLNENQNSDKISLGPLGTWPKYSIIIGGCILGLALAGSLYLVYRRNKSSESGDSHTRDRSGKTDSVFSPNSLLDSGDNQNDDDNDNYKPKNTLIKINDSNNNNGMNRSSVISSDRSSRRLSKHNKPHRESKIKQLESYVDEGEIIRNTKSVLSSLDLDNRDNHEFVPASSSVVIEVDKDSSLLTSNNNSSSNNRHSSHSSHSNRSSRSHSNRLSKVDHQNLTSTRSRDTRGSRSDHHDRKDSPSISNSNLSSSKNKNKNNAPELHHKFSTKTPSHDDKKYISNSDLVGKNNNKERSKSYQRKNKSKKSLPNQSGEKVAREKEDEDDKPLGQIISLKHLNDENSGVSIVDDFFDSVFDEALAAHSDSGSDSERTNSKNGIVSGEEKENTTKDKRFHNEKEQIIESDDEIPIGKLRK